MKKSEFMQQAVLASMQSGRIFSAEDQVKLASQARSLADKMLALTGGDFEPEVFRPSVTEAMPSVRELVRATKDLVQYVAGDCQTGDKRRAWDQVMAALEAFPRSEAGR
jgi:hypothetical protein